MTQFTAQKQGVEFTVVVTFIRMLPHLVALWDMVTLDDETVFLHIYLTSIKYSMFYEKLKNGELFITCLHCFEIFAFYYHLNEKDNVSHIRR